MPLSGTLVSQQLTHQNGTDQQCTQTLAPNCAADASRPGSLWRRPAISLANVDVSKLSKF